MQKGMKLLLHWESCRDRFQKKPFRSFLYATKKPASSFQIFFKQLEDKLGLSKRTVIETVATHILFFAPSPWWFKNEIRKAFLTMAVRSADASFDRKDFVKSLLKSRYGNGTEKAVLRFLEGYTRLKKGMWSGGWCWTVGGAVGELALIR